jgi:hypothetical protein
MSDDDKLTVADPRDQNRSHNWSYDRIVELALVGILAAVGVFQVCIYLRQANIMDKQTAISDKQTAISALSQRASVVFSRLDVKMVFDPRTQLDYRPHLGK